MIRHYIKFQNFDFDGDGFGRKEERERGDGCVTGVDLTKVKLNQTVKTKTE